MKKIIVIFILIILFLFFGISLMVGIDKNNIVNMKDDVLKNTEIEKIDYINKYGDYYLIMDLEYVYLLDSDYIELDKININKLYNNKNEYDLIYRDNEIMYMDSVLKDEGVIYKYYDIYTYKEIDTVMVGGRFDNG